MAGRPQRKPRVNYKEPDTDDEFGEADVEEEQQPPRKRIKVTATASAPAPTRKKSIAATPKKLSVTKRKKKKEKVFDFPRLAGEIRNQIYEYAFTSDQVMVIVTPLDRTTGRMDPNGEPYRRRLKRTLRIKKTRNDIAYNLLRTCKQIYHQATPYLYTNNSFHFSQPEVLLAFMARFPNAVRNLRNIRVNFNIDSGGSGSIMCMTILNTLAHVPLKALRSVINATVPTVEEAARDFYNSADDWINAAGQRNNNAFAALDILKVYRVRLASNVAIVGDWRKKFYGELENLIAQDWASEQSLELGGDDGSGDEGNEEGDD